jgi:DNA-binding NtrC family response regulator
MTHPPATDALGILIVDDENEIVDLLTLYLGQQGLRALGAATAEAGLAAVCADPAIGVLVTDLRMPGLSGPALAEEVFRNRPEAEALEVVLITGAGEGDPALEAFRDKAFAVLRKPFRPSAVAAAVGRARDAAALRRRAVQAPGEAATATDDANRARCLAATLAKLRPPLGPLLATAEALATGPVPSETALRAQAGLIRDAVREMLALVDAALGEGERAGR